MARSDKVEETISVRSDDPKKPKKEGEEDGSKSTPDDPTNANGVNGKGKDKEEVELSEEDANLKAELEMLVERLQESDSTLYRPALESLRTLIRTSTSSMTSVPKPLKFLRPHYPALQSVYSSWPSNPPKSGETISDKSLFADILSVLAMTYSDEGKRETLSYRLVGGSEEDPGVWGHEYVRHLAAEIGEEFELRQKKSLEEEDPEPAKADDLLALSKRLLPFLLSHNAESDACDLLLDIESIETLIDFVTEETYSKVGLYLVSCVNYLPPPEDSEVMKTSRNIYRKFGRFMESLVLSIKMGNADFIKEDFESPKNPHMKRQLAYLLARHQVPVDFEEDEYSEILSNSKLSEDFREFAKELSATDPRYPEDIYKSHLEGGKSSSAKVDSARANLADTFVNAFVNAGFGNDKLMVDAPEGQSWIYKNKEHGMLSAAASIGISCLWDVDVGMNHIDKYTYGSDENIKAGAILANGLLHSNIRSETALAILGGELEQNSVPMRNSAIIGLGIAYAGSSNLEVVTMLLPFVENSTLSMETSSLAALALGIVCVGSCNSDVAEAIVQTMLEREEKDLKSEFARFMGLGLALLYLGCRKEEAPEVTLATLQAIEAPIGKQTAVLVDACTFAGTGNVLKIQTMLHHCTDHLNVEEEKKEEGSSTAAEATKKDDKEKVDDLFQSLAVLGLALIAMGEDVGSEMLTRHLNHLMHYGDPVIRRTVPLALGFISVSNPALHVMDTLSKYSHDNDIEVAVNAIFAMGIIGAGTNNARLAKLLRQLASYYATQSDALFMVRIAQGLVHLGKGTIGLNPFHTDRALMSPTAVAGLLATLIAFTDTKHFIFGRYHWMLYFLVMSMYPRFLITLNEEGEKIPVSVRVGQAVDYVGQAGKPRTITGFQTHTTPVRLAHLERAELATEEFISYAHVLEGHVILTKNPGFDKDDK